LEGFISSNSLSGSIAKRAKGLRRALVLEQVEVDGDTVAVLVEAATRAHLRETVRAPWEDRQLVHGGVKVLGDGREMQNHRNFDHVEGLVLVG
jgi:hypothetical protein